MPTLADTGSPPGAARPSGPGRPLVTAVVVSHDGMRWLPRLVEALGALTRPPDVLLAADTGSLDGSPDLLASVGVPVVDLARGAGYPQAVAAALAARPPREGWIWLLHDDCVPAPDALQRLLDYVAAHPRVSLAGCKAVDVDAADRIVEVGLTMDRAGRRDRSLLPDELDQGQHDAPGPVLAVGTAGALISVAAWRATGGLDPALGLLRDDLDLGTRVWSLGGEVHVVPGAVVAHARAVATGRRAVDVTGASGVPLRRLDRRHALLSLLAGSSPRRLPATIAGAVLASVVSIVGFLATRRPGGARDEVAALAWALLRPGRVRAARRARRGLPDGPVWVRRDYVGPLLTHRRTAVLHALEAFGTSSGGRLRRARRSPAAALGVGLAVLGLVADRGLGLGLSGGRLLAVPPSSASLWRDLTSGVHAGTPPGPGLAPLWEGPLALAGLLLTSRPDRVVDLVVLAALPLAGLAAWRAVRALALPRGARLAAALGWAGLPVLAEAVVGGRPDAVAVAVGLPLLAAGCGHLLATAGRPGFGWWRAVAVGTLLTLLDAADPALDLPVAVAMTAAALVWGGRGLVRRLAATACVLAVPLAVAAPYLPGLIAARAPLLGYGGPGGLAGVTGPPAAVSLLGLRAGGPGGGIVAGGVVAALLGALGLLRLRAAGASGEAPRRAIVVGLAVGFAGLGAAAALARVAAGPGMRAWPGPALLVAGTGLLLAGAVGLAQLGAPAGSGTRRRVRAAVGAAVLAVALAVPAAGLLGLAARGAAGPVSDRALSASLPLDVDPHAVLLLSSGPGATVRASLGIGQPAGAEDTRAGAVARRALASVVARLAAPDGTAVPVPARLVALRVDDPAAARLAAALDAGPSVHRRPGSGQLALWTVASPVSLPAPRPPTGLRSAGAAVAWSAVALLVALVAAAPPPRRAPLVGRVG